MLRDIDHRACQVSQQGVKRDVLQVPHELDPLEAHHHDTRRRADDQHASAHAGAIGQELPEHAVLHEIGQINGIRRGGDHHVGRHGIHADRPGHQRDVIDHRREGTDNQVHDEDIPQARIQPTGKLGEDSTTFQGVDGEQDTQEEKKR